MKNRRPTLAAIRRWPPTVDVAQAALALGVSRSSLYQAIQQDASPVAVIHVNRRLRVLTESLLDLLDPGRRGGGQAA